MIEDMVKEITEAGGDHFTLEYCPIPYYDPMGYPRYCVQCTLCMACSTWICKDLEDPFNKKERDVLGFCKAHSHKVNVESIKTVNVNGKDWEVLSNTSNAALTASSIKKFTKKWEDSMLISPELKKDLDNYNFGLLGNIQVNFGTQNQVTAVSSEILKYIARLSDFNVDIQANRRHYRLYCGKCFNEMVLTREQVLKLEDDKYPEIKGFLLEHRHDRVIIPEGRKFR